ncbi:tRNA N6-adenosine threonylcarbamoyltransferase [Clostridia bacterium]|nr:tRNA N6-adenosine threonylcarbamoyltransferase [Clostridia bacterium]
MNILAIESSCDETAAAVVRDGRAVLSNIVRSQAATHSLYGGVVPEVASRQHLECVASICRLALENAGLDMGAINAVAVTCAPGLIGALLVGVNFAKSAAYASGLPLIPVHHMRGHIAANYLAFPELEPPFAALLVSGGHTLIVDVRSYTDMSAIGESRDDAAGEAFDKAARALGLPYPGGALLDELSRGGNPALFPFSRASIDGRPLDMSFSGLKTAVLNTINRAGQKGEALDKASLAASFCAAVSDTLVPRIIRAASELNYRKVVVSGGVAANSVIRGALTDAARDAGLSLYIPPVDMCGDNAAMIGSQAFYEFLSGNTAGLSQNAFACMEISSSFGGMTG